MPPPAPLDQIILSRHSTRSFLPTPVPPSILQTALSLAQHSPSNSNTQSWRLHLATGAARSRLTSSLLTAAAHGTPAIPPLPDAYRHFRSELGAQVYGAEGMGVARDDKAGRAKAVLRNFEFFGAPLVGVVSMDRQLGMADALGVGMWLQTLLLVLEENGVGSCVEVSVAGYPEVLRREMGIAEGMEVICGVAIGYADVKEHVNQVRSRREKWEDSVVFLEE